MTTMQARDAIERDVVDRLAVDLPGVDVLEVLVVGRADAATLRVTVDHAGGVDHGLCVDVTRSLEGAGLRDRFAIEVSSPGLEPPLRTLEHFQRALGRRVQVRVESDAGALRARTGTLIAVDDNELSLATASGVTTVSRSAVRRARMLEEAEQTADNVAGGSA
jgi:ribosome maturation factor RimP